MASKNHEGKRRRGQVNGNQSLIYSIYDSAIRRILDENGSGLNVSEIARMLPQRRDEIMQSKDVTISPDLRAKLSTIGKGDLRKTVRKHLVRMCAYGYARLINGRYYPRERPESEELLKMVNETVSTVMSQNWSSPLAEDVAIYRTYVDPPAPDPYRFDAFFADGISEFNKSFFFLERLLVDAIGSKHLSRKFFDPTSNSLKMGLLRSGWEAHFNGTKVIVWTIAINPTKFLELIQTSKGQDWTKELLTANWERILAKGNKRLAETRAMERKMRKIQRLRDKQATEAANVPKNQGDGFD